MSSGSHAPAQATKLCHTAQERAPSAPRPAAGAAALPDGRVGRRRICPQAAHAAGPAGGRCHLRWGGRGRGERGGVRGGVLTRRSSERGCPRPALLRAIARAQLPTAAASRAAAEVLGVLPDAWNMESLGSAYPPTLFLSMPRDLRTADRIQQVGGPPTVRQGCRLWEASRGRAAERQAQPGSCFGKPLRWSARSAARGRAAPGARPRRPPPTNQCRIAATAHHSCPARTWTC